MILVVIQYHIVCNFMGHDEKPVWLISEYLAHGCLFDIPFSDHFPLFNIRSIDLVLRSTYNSEHGKGNFSQNL